MFRALPYKTKQFFFLLIKLSIVFGAFYFIYQKIANNENIDFKVFWSFLVENEVFSIKNVCFLLFLSIFNWFFEIHKWQKLVSFIKKISFYDALKQSLSALTASLITPNRIGDYAAKAVHYSKSFRKRIVLLNLLSHMAQMSATLIFGVIGFSLFASKYSMDLPYFKLGRMLALVLSIGLIAALGIKQNRIKIKGFEPSKIFEFIRKMPLKIHLTNFSFSVIRYLIFSYQFYFLLCIFGIDVSYLNAMMIITTMYLIASIIPTFFILDIVVKGSIALYLFDIVGVNNLTILCITLLMWILNFVFPSIIGSFYVLNFKSLNVVPDTQRE